MAAALRFGIALRGDSEDDDVAVDAAGSMFGQGRDQFYSLLDPDDRPVVFHLTIADDGRRGRPGGFLMTERKAILVEVASGLFRSKALPASIVTYSDLRNLGVHADPPVRAGERFVSRIGTGGVNGWQIYLFDSEGGGAAATVVGLISGTVTPDFGEDGIEGLVFQS